MTLRNAWAEREYKAALFFRDMKKVMKHATVILLPQITQFDITLKPKVSESWIPFQTISSVGRFNDPRVFVISSSDYGFSRILLAFCVDRFLAIGFPLHHHTKYRRFSYIALAAIFLGSALNALYIPIAYYWMLNNSMLQAGRVIPQLPAIFRYWRRIEMWWEVRMTKILQKKDFEYTCTPEKTEIKINKNKISITRRLVHSN